MSQIPDEGFVLQAPKRAKVVTKDIKSDFVVSTVYSIRKHGVLLHFLPAGSKQGVILHGLVEKIKRVE